MSLLRPNPRPGRYMVLDYLGIRRSASPPTTTYRANVNGVRFSRAKCIALVAEIEVACGTSAFRLHHARSRRSGIGPVAAGPKCALNSVVELSPGVPEAVITAPPQ